MILDLKLYIIADHNTLSNIFKIIGDGSNYNAKIEFVNEENPEGTASALKLLKGIVKTTFLAVQCDLIIDHVNLLDLWQHHLQGKNVSTLLVSSSVFPQGSGKIYGAIKMHGNKVLSYVERQLPNNIETSIYFGGVFVAEPELLAYNGKSLEFEVFPQLAKRGYLGGILTCEDHLHIHTHQDLINVRKRLKEI